LVLECEQGRTRENDSVGTNLQIRRAYFV